MKIRNALSAFLVGAVNSLFGAGAGIICVRAMKKSGLSQKKAQSSALAVMLPLSFISAVIYALRGNFSFTDSLIFIPFGFTGALAGVFLMSRIKPDLLKVVFAVFIIYTGVRMIIR